MPAVYNRTHTIEIRIYDPNQTFGYSASYNTWTDWHLIPASRPFVAQPQPNFNIVQLPGSSNFLDLTGATPGGLTFGQRTGEWRFYIDHNYWNSWIDAVNTIANAIHGKTVIAILLDDPSMQYIGRIAITDYEPGESYSTITFTYTFQANPDNVVTYPVDPSDGNWNYSGGSSSGTGSWTGDVPSGGGSSSGGSSSGGSSSGGSSSGGSSSGSGGASTTMSSLIVNNASENTYYYGDSNIEYLKADNGIAIRSINGSTATVQLRVDVTNINASNIMNTLYLGYRKRGSGTTIESLMTVLQDSSDNSKYYRTANINISSSDLPVYVDLYIRKLYYSNVNGKINYSVSVSSVDGTINSEVYPQSGGTSSGSSSAGNLSTGYRLFDTGSTYTAYNNVRYVGANSSDLIVDVTNGSITARLDITNISADADDIMGNCVLGYTEDSSNTLYIAGTLQQGNGDVYYASTSMTFSSDHTLYFDLYVLESKASSLKNKLNYCITVTGDATAHSGASSGTSSGGVTSGEYVLDLDSSSENTYIYNNEEYLKASNGVTDSTPPNTQVLLEIENVSSTESDIKANCFLGYRKSSSNTTSDQNTTIAFMMAVYKVTGETDKYRCGYTIDESMYYYPISMDLFVKKSGYTTVDQKIKYRLTLPYG